MTIQELYDWAKENDVLNAEISVHNSYGEQTSYIEPSIVKHNYFDNVKRDYTDEIAYIEIEL